MSNQIHIAAQYLAAASISFLPKKEDDSHTNLGFNKEKGYLETWPLNDRGCKITFDYLNFSLHWVANNTVRLSILLDKKTHREVLNWLESLTTSLTIKKPYAYKLHYELPYDSISDDFVFKKPSNNVLRELLHNRIFAQNVLEKTIEITSLESDIRIWPHHFDTGAFSSIKKSDLSIGLGLAIPDSTHDEYYFYISAYKGHNGVDTSSFDSLSLGEWKNKDFKGAVLPISDIDEEKGITFFKEAISTYKN